jgi:hypothetical protein
VFNVSPKTTCSNANLLAVVDTPQSTDVNSNQHYFYFREFTGSASAPVTITCDNYNNPIYEDPAVGPFTIIVFDREEPPNAIGTYPAFTFAALGLKPRTATLPLAFQLFELTTPTIARNSKNPIPI